MYNQYDLSKIYGFPMSSPAPYVNDITPNTLLVNQIPSLEQIASYNQAEIQSEESAAAGRNQNSSSNENMWGAPMTPNSEVGQSYTPVGQTEYPEHANTFGQLSLGNLATPATTIGQMGMSGVMPPSTTPMRRRRPNRGGMMAPPMPELGLAGDITSYSNPFPVTPESIQFMNGLVRTQIGRRARIDFLIGSSNMVSKDGYILGVGSNYILLNEIDTNDITACDFYNIKFIRFYY